MGGPRKSDAISSHQKKKERNERRRECDDEWRRTDRVTMESGVSRQSLSHKRKWFVPMGRGLVLEKKELKGGVSVDRRPWDIYQNNKDKRETMRGSRRGAFIPESKES